LPVKVAVPISYGSSVLLIAVDGEYKSERLPERLRERANNTT
jgi:hypothetical protein